MGRRRIRVAILGIGLFTLFLCIGWNKIVSLGESDDLPPGIVTIKAEYSSFLDVVKDPLKAIDLALNPPMTGPPCPLTSKDREKPVKVAIVTKASPHATFNFSGVENEFTEIFSKALKKAFRRNNERIAIVEAGDLEEYYRAHPSWRTESVLGLGKKVRADYVIEVEIDQLKINEELFAEAQKKTRGMKTFRRVATCDIVLKVIGVENPELDPIWKQDYLTDFPRFNSPPDTGELSEQEFRRRFLAFIAR